jgi:hypothetical protein
VFLGAGDGPCAILAVGTRSGGDVIYPVSQAALGHGAGVSQETRDPRQAYADIPADVPIAFGEQWLAGTR